MKLVSQGRRNKEIATLLSISEQTAHVHLKNIFAYEDSPNPSCASSVVMSNRSLAL
jgi:DNA-binding CsgD family transcriptional regulator